MRQLRPCSHAASKLVALSSVQRVNAIEEGKPESSILLGARGLGEDVHVAESSR